MFIVRLCSATSVDLLKGVKCQYQPNVSSEGGGDICIDIKILGLPPTKDSLYVLPAFVLITIPLLH